VEFGAIPATYGFKVLMLFVFSDDLLLLLLQNAYALLVFRNWAYYCLALLLCCFVAVRSGPSGSRGPYFIIPSEPQFLRHCQQIATMLLRPPATRVYGPKRMSDKPAHKRR